MHFFIYMHKLISQGIYDTKASIQNGKWKQKQEKIFQWESNQVIKKWVMNLRVYGKANRVYPDKNKGT